jgi:hypothetical protein
MLTPKHISYILSVKFFGKYIKLNNIKSLLHYLGNVLIRIFVFVTLGVEMPKVSAAKKNRVFFGKTFKISFFPLTSPLRDVQ